MAVYKRKKKLKSGKIQTYYFFKFDLNGHTYQGVPVRHTLADAKEAEHQARAKAMRGISGKSPAIAVFIREEYLPFARLHKKDAEREVKLLDDFIGFFPGRRLDEIKARDIREFLKHRASIPTQHGRPRLKGTLNRELSILSSVYALALSEERCEENPCSKVDTYKTPPGRLLYWTEEEERRGLEYLNNEREHLRGMVIVAIHTGMRREEFLSLKVEHCDFENRLIHVYAPKTETIRYVAMERNVRDELLALCEKKKPGDYVFINPLTDDRYYDPKKGIKRASELAGVKCIDWHGLRHTRGTRLAMRGMNAFQIAAELGHSDIRTSQRYVHLAEAAKRATEAKKLFDNSKEEGSEGNRWKIDGMEKAG